MRKKSERCEKLSNCESMIWKTLSNNANKRLGFMSKN